MEPKYEIDRIGTFFQIRNAAGSFWQIQITFSFWVKEKKMQFQKKKFSISSALFTAFFELGQFFQADFQVKNCALNLLDRQYITLQGNWNLQFKTSESR